MNLETKLDINNKDKTYDAIVEENSKVKKLLQKSYDILIEVKNETIKIENKYKEVIEKSNELENRNKSDLNKIIQLESKVIELDNDKKDLEKKNSELRSRIDALRNSKLGKINVAYWKFKNRLKENNDGGY